ncbi:MAG TPA: efflux RND transporter periplasmic adaptor subunit [Thermoanaerobaculia bacterium]|nr:efflux RND transporter periplasmic adaptor subunit [Thermoanaerobaculia bacterium]
MKRTLIIGGAVIVVAVIVLFSIKSTSSNAEQVYIDTVKTKKIESVVTAPAEINPSLKVNISAHIVGKIERLYIKEGDMVRRNQKLIDLERPAYEAQYQRAQAEVQNRKIEVERARVALATADLAYKRAVNMQTQGIQAQEIFEKAKLDIENARAGYASAQEGVRQAVALLTSSQTDLSHTTIVSPIDGKVVQLNAHEGEVVVTGTMNNPASVIAVIADLAEILAEADVGETEVVGIKLGQPAKIKVDAVPDKDYVGRVVEIGSSATQRASAGSGMRYFKVKSAIENADDRLRPGMTAQVSITTLSAPSAVAVPIQAVVERVPPVAGAKKTDTVDENAPKKKYVFVVKDGVAKMTEVATGISDATNVAITSGVKAGDKIVTGPFRILKSLKDGAHVEATKEPAKETKT